MKKISNHTELVVIFRKEKRKNEPTIFWAHDVLPGAFNRKDMTFTAKYHKMKKLKSIPKN